MNFPDRIERTIDLPHQPERVWAALTTPEGLSGWFGKVAAIDLTPGAEFDMRFEQEQHTAHVRIAAIEPPRRFAYTWGMITLPEDDPRKTHVEFVLEPTTAGTRLTVTETGFAQAGGELGAEAHRMNTGGWAGKIDDLAAYLNVAHA